VAPIYAKVDREENAALFFASHFRCGLFYLGSENSEVLSEAGK
jgi:hypothetical protein